MRNSKSAAKMLCESTGGGKRRKRRRNLDRSVTRKVFLYAGGKLVKTIRHKISVAQAIKEIGKDPFTAEAMLNAGPPVKVSRTLCKGVRVKLVWYGDGKIDPALCDTPTATMFSVGTSDAVTVAKAGGIF